MGALLELVRARRQEIGVELSDEMSDDEAFGVLSKFLSDLVGELERPVALGHDVTAAELEDLHANCIDLLDQIAAMERHEQDVAEGIEYQCAVPITARQKPKAAPLPPAPAAAKPKPPPPRGSSDRQQASQRGSDRSPPPVEPFAGIKRGYVVSYDLRSSSGVAMLVGTSTKVIIPASAVIAAGITFLMANTPVEFRMVQGQDGLAEAEPGTLKLAGPQDGAEPAGLSGWDFARQRYSGAR